MKIIHDISSIGLLNFSVVTLGTFDGVHAGHRKILKQVVATAQQNNGESIVVTFWPHPKFVLGSSKSELKLLSTFEEKASLIASCGIDYIVKIPFTREFSELTSAEFIEHYLIRSLRTKILIIGYDHKFGRDREGSFEYLQANQSNYGFQIIEIPRQDIDQVGVSSTRIRKALMSGEMQVANHYLTVPFSIAGIVTKGAQLGRKIGFPTANIYVPDDHKLIPADGVYAVWVYLHERRYGGMLNIGNRPTVNGDKQTIEVNIFEFDEDIYGENIRIEFIDKIRNEVKFSSIEALKNQLGKDKLISKRIFKKSN